MKFARALLIAACMAMLFLLACDSQEDPVSPADDLAGDSYRGLPDGHYYSRIKRNDREEEKKGKAWLLR